MKKTVCLFLLILLIGCVTWRGQNDRIGFKYFNKGRETLPQVQVSHTVVIPGPIIVHFEPESYFVDPVVGMARINIDSVCHIHVIGVKVGNKIWMDRAILGHEFYNILRYHDPEIFNIYKFMGLE